MSEPDLILVLNKALGGVGEEVDIRFSQVMYLPSGAVSAFLLKKLMLGC